MLLVAFGQAKLVQKAGAAGRGLYGDTAGLQSLTAAQLKRVHISGRQGVHVPTLEDFLRCALVAALSIASTVCNTLPFRYEGCYGGALKGQILVYSQTFRTFDMVIGRLQSIRLADWHRVAVILWVLNPQNSNSMPKLAPRQVHGLFT